MSALGRVLGVDYGHVRIGLALSDPDRKLSFSLATYARQTLAQDQVYFAKLVKEEAVTLLVVGLPVHLSGHEGGKALEARRFGTWLTTVTALPVIYWDERFTTVEAEKILWDAGLSHKQRKERRDKLAAQILLRTFLDAGCPMQVVDPGPLG